MGALIEAARAEWSAPPAVNKHWTSEQAWDVQKAFEAANPGAERGPAFAWHALHRLDSFEEGYNTGTKPNLLLYAMWLCIKNDIPLPDWVKKAFLEAYEKGCNGKLRSMSWNEVFGRPPRTKQQCDRFNRDYMALPEIWRLVVAAWGSPPFGPLSISARPRSKSRFSAIFVTPPRRSRGQIADKNGQDRHDRHPYCGT